MAATSYPKYSRIDITPHPYGIVSISHICIDASYRLSFCLFRQHLSTFGAGGFIHSMPC